MTTHQALLAMKIGCKISADWMKPDVYYFIQGIAIHASDDWSNFMSSKTFLRMFDKANDWYIV